MGGRFVVGCALLVVGLRLVDLGQLGRLVGFVWFRFVRCLGLWLVWLLDLVWLRLRLWLLDFVGRLHRLRDWQHDLGHLGRRQPAVRFHLRSGLGSRHRSRYPQLC